MFTFQLENQTEHQTILLCLTAHDGHWFAGGSDARIHGLDSSGKTLPSLQALGGHQSYVTGVASSESFLWSVGYDGLLNAWKPHDNTLHASHQAHQKWVRDIQVAPHQPWMATVGDDMKVMIWDALTAQLIHSLEGHAKQSPQGFSSMLYTCAFSPDGTLLATADRIGEILLWELPSGKLLQKMSAPAMYTWDEVQRLRSIGGIRSLAFSTDQQTLAVGGMGHVQNVDGLGGKARVEWFDLQSGEPSGLFESDSHKGLVESLQYHPSEPYLIAAGGSGKGFLMLVDPLTQKAIHETESPMYVHQIALSQDANSLLAVGHHRTAEWSLLKNS